MTSRADVVAMARSFIGTPYHHMGRQPGLGLDCAGLVICVARALGLVAADFDVPTYRAQPDGTLLDWCGLHMTEIARTEAVAGDVAVLVLDADPQHLAILGDYRNGGRSLIHAARGHGVIETRLLISRAQKLVAAYALPGVE